MCRRERIVTYAGCSRVNTAFKQTQATSPPKGAHHRCTPPKPASSTPHTPDLLYVLSTCMKYASNNISTSAISSSSMLLTLLLLEEELLLELLLLEVVCLLLLRAAASTCACRQ